MRDITGTDLENVAAGNWVKNWFIRFDFDGDLYGIHAGTFGTINFEGLDYAGAGSLLEIEQIDQSVDLSASPIVVRLRAQPDDEGLTPDVLATIDTQPWKNAPVTLTRVYFDPATGAVVKATQWFGGFVDTIEHDENVGGEYALVGTFEPRSLDHSRRGHRMSGDADQRLIDADDAFFEHSARTRTEKLTYGRATTTGGGGTGQGST